MAIEGEVVDSSSDEGPVQPPASTSTCGLPLPGDLVMPAQADIVFQHARIAATPRKRDDLPRTTADDAMDMDNSLPATCKPASGTLPPSIDPTLVPLPMVSHQAASSPPALAPQYSVPVAASTNVSPSLANEGNDLSRTTIDDAMELDNNLTSTGGPAHGALKPSMQPSPASVPVPLPPGVNNQESTSNVSALKSHSASNVVGQMQPKRGLGDDISTDEEGMKAPSKWGSKRRRFAIQESGEEVNATKSTSKSSSQPTRAAPQTPSAAWFSNFQKMFLEKDLGMEWKDLVSSWASFEEKSLNTKVRRLSAAGRPEVVGMWISRRRATTFQPNISSLEDYESEFNGWWKSLQPNWRISNDKVDKALSQGDWDCLKFPGINGVISVVVALFYWGLASQGKMAHRKAWLTAVEDCATVFSLL